MMMDKIFGFKKCGAVIHSFSNNINSTVNGSATVLLFFFMYSVDRSLTGSPWHIENGLFSILSNQYCAYNVLFL